MQCYVQFTPKCTLFNCFLKYNSRRNYFTFLLGAIQLQFVIFQNFTSNIVLRMNVNSQILIAYTKIIKY